MKHRIKFFVLVGLLLLPTLATPPAAQAQTPTGNVIVRLLPNQEGLLQSVCSALNICVILETIDGTLNTVFLVQPLLGIPVAQLIQQLLNLPRICLPLLGCLPLPTIVDAEPDLFMNVEGYAAPPGLSDTTSVYYYNSNVWEGYINQPAVSNINLQEIQSAEGTGAGIVAVIDTGVDTTQRVLQPVLVQGKSFFNSNPSYDEKTDLSSNPGDVDVPDASAQHFGGTGHSVVWATAVLDPNHVNVLNGQQKYPAAFGHGTMVSGIVHLVAPTAKIMPLKAFGPDGTGQLSDVLRAIYYATQHGANILNMSFEFSQTVNSTELGKATNYASSQGLVSVAAMGNDARQLNCPSTCVYPAALPTVVGIASTSVASQPQNDALSSFSNYGSPTWEGAPGEAIITPFPFNTYAAGWGTSFATPFISGTVALMRSVSSSNLNQTNAASMLRQGVVKTGDSRLGNGVLDSYQSVMAWCTATGRC